MVSTITQIAFNLGNSGLANANELNIVNQHIHTNFAELNVKHYLQEWAPKTPKVAAYLKLQGHSMAVKQ